MPKNSGPKKAKKRAHLKRNLVFFCSCCAAAVLLFLTSVNLKSLSSTKVLGAEDIQRENPSEEISFWEDFLAKSPTYFDGWVELSYLMDSLGNKEAAGVALDKAQEINPNSDKLEELRNLLGK